MDSLVKPVPTIVPLLSKDYQGEWITTSTGDKEERKFVEYPTLFFRNGGNAIVFGNGLSRDAYPIKRFNMNNLNKRLDYYNILYGCNMAYTEGELDFLVMTNKILASQLPKSLSAVKYGPKEFLKLGVDLIPQQLRMDAGALAVYLACFHGASRVFLYGFDGQDTPGMNNNRFSGMPQYDDVSTAISDLEWHENLYQVMAAYQNVQFYRIDNFPESSRKLFQLSNYQVTPFRSFVSLADL